MNITNLYKGWYVNYKKRLGFYCVVIFYIICPFLEAKTKNYIVEKIVDGDTIWVQPMDAVFWEITPMFPEGSPKTRIKIRMMGIDAPESHLPTENYGVVGQQPWGDISTQNLKSLIKEGYSVRLLSFGTDKYGRTLAYVFHRNKDVNFYMIGVGQAVPYIICSNPYCDKNFFKRHNVEEYLIECSNAEKAKKGIFNPKNPLIEMPFEFRMRMMEKDPDKYVGDFFTKELYEPEDYNEVELCSRVFFYSYNDALKLGFKWARK